MKKLVGKGRGRYGIGAGNRRDDCRAACGLDRVRTTERRASELN
jgi:hypothetical protein